MLSSRNSLLSLAPSNPLRFKRTERENLRTTDTYALRKLLKLRLPLRQWTKRYLKESSSLSTSTSAKKRVN